MAGSRFSNGTPGVDIRDRLTLSTGNSLGIRSHLDHSMLSNRSDSTGRSFDPWTTSQPGYASHPAYTTPMASYHQTNPPYSVPPTTTTSYELHTGYAPYSDTTYQTPRHSMPPVNYNTSSNVHHQSEQIIWMAMITHTTRAATLTARCIPAERWMTLFPMILAMYQTSQPLLRIQRAWPRQGQIHISRLPE